MTHIEVETGVRIHAQIVGTGRPVVLLHGWAFDHRIWDRQVRVLAETGHTTIAVDLRGHGRSDRPYGDYPVKQLAQDVVSVIETLTPGPVVLVGWSLGGVTAFRAAVQAPELVTKLVLVGSNGVAASRQPDFPFGQPASAHLPTLRAAELTDRLQARRRLLRSAFATSPDDTVVEHLLQLTLDTPSWAGAATLATLLNCDQVADLPRLRVPVVQIIGDKDPVFSRRGAAWLAEQIPGMQQIVLRDCGHYPMVEAADAFDQALLTATADQRLVTTSDSREPQ
jgi:non-heme chloroperoxidase